VLICWSTSDFKTNRKPVVHISDIDILVKANVSRRGSVNVINQLSSDLGRLHVLDALWAMQYC